MKLSVAVAVFIAEASGKSRRHLNLHETGYDHGHLADQNSCTNKANMYELDSQGMGCDAYNGSRSCGAYDDFDFVASSLCCACGGGLREEVQVNGWGVLDPRYAGQRIRTDDRPPREIERPSNRVIYYDRNTGEYSDFEEHLDEHHHHLNLHSGASDFLFPACFDSNMSYGDSAGDKCEWYTEGTNASTCGSFDTADFKANEMCCACGGGSDQPVEFIMECHETSNGATDSAGDPCDWYTTNASYCGAFDTAEFSANDMCCACSGGEERPFRIRVAIDPAPVLPEIIYYDEPVHHGGYTRTETRVTTEEQIVGGWYPDFLEE